MKLSNLRIQNLRSCRDLDIAFDDYTCLVGQNGAGKSTILTALNILFRNSAGVTTGVAALSEEDFCNKDTSTPISIVATFSHLSAEEATEFKNYVRHGKLVVTARATWDAAQRSAEVKQFGARLVMRSFAPFFERLKDGAKAPELKTLYSQFRIDYPELPSATSKDDMESALRGFEEAHAEQCELIDSEDQFYGYTRGSNRLKKYIQWVYVPAVKDASSEQDEAKNTALGELLQRTLRPKIDLADALDEIRKEAGERYAAVVATTESALQEASRSLESRLRAWSHSAARVELRWNTDADRAVAVQPPVARAKIGDDAFVGDVPRMGHGLQRAFIVSVLQELAENGTAGAGPRLLLGFEEPELYQHPPQARHLSRVLQDLSTQGAQVLVTTHSPYFVSGRGFESIRMIRRRHNGEGSVSSAMSHAQLSERLAAAAGGAPIPPTSTMATLEQILQPSLNELFFCGIPVIVEGVEDIAFIATYMELTGRWSEFRRNGCHFVVAGGKDGLRRPLAIAAGLDSPVFAIFDADADCKADQAIANHELNKTLMNLCGVDGIDPAVNGHAVGNVVVWRNNIASSVQDDLGSSTWSHAEDQARTKFGFFHGVRAKNAMLIAATLEELFKTDLRCQSLEKACQLIIEFAQQQSSAASAENALELASHELTQTLEVETIAVVGVQ